MASMTKAMSKRMTSLTMLQVLVTNKPDASLLGQLPDSRADQSIELVLKLVKRRVRVKLGIARGQTLEETRQIVFVHARILEQPKDKIGVLNLLPLELRPRARGKKRINNRVTRTVQPSAARHSRVEPKRVAHETHTPDPPLSGVLEQDGKHHGMEVYVQMPVHMIEEQATVVEAVEL